MGTVKYSQRPQVNKGTKVRGFSMVHPKPQGSNPDEVEEDQSPREVKVNPAKAMARSTSVTRKA